MQCLILVEQTILQFPAQIDESSTTFCVGDVASGTSCWGPYAQRFSAVGSDVLMVFLARANDDY